MEATRDEVSSKLGYDFPARNFSIKASESRAWGLNTGLPACYACAWPLSHQAVIFSVANLIVAAYQAENSLIFGQARTVTADPDLTVLWQSWLSSVSTPQGFQRCRSLMKCTLKYLCMLVIFINQKYVIDKKYCLHLLRHLESHVENKFISQPSSPVRQKQTPSKI